MNPPLFVLLVLAVVLCGLGLRDVLSRTDEEFRAIRQSRRLWTWVFVALIALILLSVGVLAPAGLALGAMYQFVYKRRLDKLDDVEIVEGED